MKNIVFVILIILLFNSCSTRIEIITSFKNEEFLNKNKKAIRYPIYPISKGWKSANVDDVQAVSISVASILMPLFSQKIFNPIILKNREEGPKTLYARGKNNEYIVWVDINGRYWSQLVYQFSHELGHILSNYGSKSGKNQWFEEALCEAVSLYTLEKMSIEWQDNPPYPNWKNYANSLEKYLNNMLKEEHRTIREYLSIWYQNNEKILRSNPYIRDKNEVVATAIYRLIELKKFNLSTIQYLNLGTPNKDKSFSTYLHEWYENSPEKNQEDVLNIIELLGITI